MDIRISSDVAFGRQFNRRLILENNVSTDIAPRAESNLDAVNQDFKRFDQVHKPQHYRLSESGFEMALEEQFDDDFQIRICDMADFFHGGDAGKARFAESLGQAMQEIGFAILVGHGIDTELFERTEAAIARFFAETPEAARVPYLAKRFGSVNQGYFPIEQSTIIFPDQVEGWVFAGARLTWMNRHSMSPRTGRARALSHCFAK